MSEHKNKLSRRSFIGGGAALGVATFVAPTVAFAETAAEKQAQADSVRNQLVGLQADLEAAGDNFAKAIEEKDAATAAMQAEQAKIDEANNQITNLQAKLGTRARSMYRSGSSSFLDFVMGAASFSEFTQNWDFLNQMNENDGEMVDETKVLREQLQASKEEFARQEIIAAEKAAEAKVIQDSVEVKVNNAAQLVSSLDAEAQALLAEEQAAAARAAAVQREAELEAQRQNTPAGSNGSNNGNSNNNNNNNDDSNNNDDYTPPASGGSGGSVGSYDSVVGYAYSCIGTPYEWGGSTPGSGLDCSGLVVWCYAQMGVSLPHQTESLYARAKNRVPVSQARPGDVLYRNGHVGIAAGYGGMPYVHAPTFGAYVRDTDSLSWSQFTCALQF